MGGAGKARRQGPLAHLTHASRGVLATRRPGRACGHLPGHGVLVGLHLEFGACASFLFLLGFLFFLEGGAGGDDKVHIKTDASRARSKRLGGEERK